MLLPVVNPSKYILTLRTKLRLTPSEVDQILRNFAPYFPERASRNVELRSHTMESSTRPSERGEFAYSDSLRAGGAALSVPDDEPHPVHTFEHLCGRQGSQAILKNRVRTDLYWQ